MKTHTYIIRVQAYIIWLTAQHRGDSILKCTEATGQARIVIRYELRKEINKWAKVLDRVVNITLTLAPSEAIKKR